MLKQFWPTTPNAGSSPLPAQPADQVTPRAAPAGNPFDAQQQQQAPRSPSLGPQAHANPPPGSASPRAAPSGLHISSTAGSASANSGLRTPTIAEFPPSPALGTGPGAQGPLPAVLGTPGASRPTTGITVGDSLGGAQNGIGFGLREPPKMRRALTKEKERGREDAGEGAQGEGAAQPTAAAENGRRGDGSGSSSGSAATAGARSGLANSLSVDVGAGSGASGAGSGSATPSRAGTTSVPSTAASSAHGHSSAPRGTLTIKLIAARGLNVLPPSSAHPARPRPEPYVVIQFEQNEFVSRPPIPASPTSAKTPFATATTQPAGGAGAGGGKPSALPRTNSYGPSLGIGSISRAFADAARRTKGGRDKDKGGTGSGTSTPKVVEEPKEASAGGLGSGSNAAEPVWKEEVAFDLTNPNSLIYVTVYDRSQDGEGFLGMKEIKPVLRDGMTVDNWFTLSSRGDEKVSGEIWLQISYDARKSKQHLTPKDFDIMKLIGRGTFGRVYQVRKRDTKRIYAMKMLSKKDIVAKKEIAHTIGERKILQRSLDSPFLVGLKFSFQTEEFLFFITDYKSGGELFWHLQKEGRFTEQRARFYIAELVLALGHLHKYDIVYRDLKPENILLDATGHVALCDFGLSKPDLGKGELTTTFCGTTEYLAPEVLLDDHGYSKLVDFWSLGVLLFEMCCGWSPFYSEDVQQMYKNICFGKIRFPRGVINEDGKQFVKGLLNRNPKHRLGAERDAAELQEHPFFKSIDWKLLAAKQVTPPFKPVVESDESVANFDPLFTSSDLRDIPFDFSQPGDDQHPGGMTGGHSYNGPGGGIPTDRNGVPVSANDGVNIKPNRPAPHPMGTPLTSSVQENFRGFTYTGESMLPQSVGALRIDADVDEEYDEEEDYDDMDVADEGVRTRRQSDVDMDA